MTELPPDARRVDAIGPGTRLREWEVIRFVGRGAFGMVFEARRSSWVDPEIGSSRALKVFDPILSSSARSALVAEFATIREMRHPNLVAGDDAFDLEDGPLAGCVVFVMELCDTDLSAEVQRSHGVLGTADAALIVAEVADGLAALHDHGRIHGDVKPENILRRADTWKLGDFGVSGVIEGSYAMAPGVTIDYRPPEFSQADEGVRLHRSADIWALGVTLHVTCAGRHPFPGPDPFMRYAALLRGERQPAPGLDPRLSHLIDERCLNPDPRRRATAGELAVELRLLATEVTGSPVLDRDPDSTRPVGPPMSEPPPARVPQGQSPTIPQPVSTAYPPPGQAFPPFPSAGVAGTPLFPTMAHDVSPPSPALDQTGVIASGSNLTDRNPASFDEGQIATPPSRPSTAGGRLGGWKLPLVATIVTIAITSVLAQLSVVFPAGTVRRAAYFVVSIAALTSLLFVTLQTLRPSAPWRLISILGVATAWAAVTAVLFVVGSVG